MPEQGPSAPQDEFENSTDHNDTERAPFNQQRRQTENELLRAVHQPGDEDDPERTNVIPQPATGEQRWVRDDLGALDSEGGHDWTNQVGTVTGPTPPVASPAGDASAQGEWPPIGGDQNQDWNPQEYAIQGDMMGGGPTVQDAPFAEGAPPGPVQPAGNDGFLEQGIEGPPDETYGQGLTRQFAPASGGEQGIEQQDALQSQQYEREEKRSQQGILGAVGDMFGGLFGNAKRTPDDDEGGEGQPKGEAAGEANP